MKNKKLIIGIALLWIFIIIFGWRYYIVNKKYPATIVEKYKMNEEVNIAKVKYTVIKEGINNIEERKDCKLYYVKMIIENTNNKDVDIRMSDIELRLGSFSASYSIDYFTKFNDLGNEFTIKAGEKISIILPYEIYDNFVADKKLNRIMDYRRELTFTKYPKKIVVEL